MKRIFTFLGIIILGSTQGLAETWSLPGTLFGDMSQFDNTLPQPGPDSPEQLLNMQSNTIRYDDTVETMVRRVPVSIRIGGADFKNIKVNCDVDLLFAHTELRLADGSIIREPVRQVRAAVSDHGMGFHYSYPIASPGPVTVGPQRNSGRVDLGLINDGSDVFLGPVAGGAVSVAGPDCVNSTPIPTVDWKKKNADGLWEECQPRHQTAISIRDPRYGSFSAVSYTRVSDHKCREYTVQARINAPEKPFDVIATAPGTSLCGVVEPEYPTIKLRFNKGVDPSSLSAVRLLDAKDANYQITTQIEDEETVTIRPVNALPMAIEMRIEIKTGPAGLQAWDGIPLRDREEDLEVLRFHTSPLSVNTDRHEDFIDRAKIYQVAEDRPLLKDRAVAARIWSDWRPEGSDDDSDLREFCIKARGVQEVNGEATATILFPEKEKLIRVQEDYSADEKRQGKASANLFEWTADPSIEDIQFQITPKDYHSEGGDDPADAPKATISKAVQHLPHEPAHMKIIYARLNLGEIAEFLELKEVDNADVQSHFEAAERYAWQVFPVSSVTAQQLPDVTLEDLGLKLELSSIAGIYRLTVDSPGPSGTENYIGASGVKVRLLGSDTDEGWIKGIVRQAAKNFSRQACANRNTVCFLVHPEIQRTHRDITERIGGTIYRGVRFSESLFIHRSELTTDGFGVTHEIGHSYGMTHIPRADTSEESSSMKALLIIDADFEFKDFDSTRMEHSGLSAHYKHGDDGNSQSTRSLMPLMFPTIVQEDLAMITDTHYDWMIYSIYEKPSASIEPAGTSSPESGRKLVDFLPSRVTFDHHHPELSHEHQVHLGQTGTANGTRLEFLLSQEADGWRVLWPLMPMPDLVDPNALPTTGTISLLVRAGGAEHHFGTDPFDEEGALQRVVVYLPFELADIASVTVLGPESETLAHWEYRMPEAISDLVVEPMDNQQGARVSWSGGGEPGMPVRLLSIDTAGVETLLGVGSNSGSFDIPQEFLTSDTQSLVRLEIGYPGAVVTQEAPITVTRGLTVVQSRFSTSTEGVTSLDVTFDRPVVAADTLRGLPVVYAEYALRDTDFMQGTATGQTSDRPDQLRFMLLAAPSDCENLELKIQDHSGVLSGVQMPSSLSLMPEGAEVAICSK